MTIEIGFTDELTNTRYAPLAVLSAHYQQNHTLQPLDRGGDPDESTGFSGSGQADTGLFEHPGGLHDVVRGQPKLRMENMLASVWEWPRFADQSSLSRTLDLLTQTNIVQLRQSTAAICRSHSQAETP